MRMDALAKELYNVGVAYELRQRSTGSQWLEESHGASSLGCEDGLHEESQMGA